MKKILITVLGLLAAVVAGVLGHRDPDTGAHAAAEEAREVSIMKPAME